MLWTAHSWPNCGSFCGLGLTKMILTILNLLPPCWASAAYWYERQRIPSVSKQLMPGPPALLSLQWVHVHYTQALAINPPERKMNAPSTLPVWNAYTTDHMIHVTYILTGLYMRPSKPLWISLFYSNSRLETENSGTHRPVALFRADARPWWTPGIFPQQCWMKDFCRSFCCCIIVCLPGF